MIKIFSEKDYKYFRVKDVLHEILCNILNSLNYLEFSDGRNFILGMRNKKSREIICAIDETSGDFLRKVRDNNKFVVSQCNRKNIIQKIYNTQDQLNSVLKQLVDMQIKTQKQLLSFADKTENLSKRLEGVFVITSDGKNVPKVFDSKDTLVVIPSFDQKFQTILENLKESKVLLFLSEDKIPYKKLKQLGLNNLSYKKHSTKHVWTKNINVNEYVNTEQ